MFTESTPSSIKDVKTYTSLEATSLVTKKNQVKFEILVKDLLVSKYILIFSFQTLMSNKIRTLFKHKKIFLHCGIYQSHFKKFCSIDP